VLEIVMSLFVKSIILLCMLTSVFTDAVNVYIMNSLEGGEDLKLHCKFKDDDLGQHLLHVNETSK